MQSYQSITAGTGGHSVGALHAPLTEREGLFLDTFKVLFYGGPLKIRESAARKHWPGAEAVGPQSEKLDSGN